MYESKSDIKSENKNRVKNRKNGLFSAAKSYFSRYAGGGIDRKTKILIRYIISGAGNALLAFILGRAEMIYGAYPFALALICAGEKYTPFIITGALISALFVKGLSLPLVIVYSALALARYAVGKSRKIKLRALWEEDLSIRILYAVSSAFALGMYRSISGGFLLYDLIGLLFSVALTPIAAFLFSGVTLRKNRHSVYFELGIYAVCAALVFALKSSLILGFNTGYFVSSVITIYMALNFDALRGCAMGLILGTAVNPIYAPALGIAGIFAGLLSKKSKTAAIFSSAAAAILYGLYFVGYRSLSVFSPDYAAAVLIMLPLSKLGLLPKIRLSLSHKKAEKNDGDLMRRAQADNTAERLDAISDAMSSLSGMFRSLSDYCKKPEYSSLRRMCAKKTGALCGTCSVDICPSAAREKLDNITKTLLKNGEITEDNPLISHCAFPKELSDSLNDGYSELLRQALDKNKTEVFAMDYEAMATLLKNTISETALDHEIDPMLSGKLYSTARYLDFSAENIYVYGKRKLHIIAESIDLPRSKTSTSLLRRSFENACGRPLTLPTFTLNGPVVNMYMDSDEAYYTEVARAYDQKSGETLCGDTIGTFTTKEGYFYMLISDGMGSGREAALTSRVCAMFLEKMLCAGNSVVTTLKMLNNFIRSKNTESHTTVDLLEIDLLDGRACFIKGGAAPSYILRENRLFKIASNTLPVGITREIDAELVRFSLRPDDIVVMVSDGVASDFEDGVWLADTITFGWDKERSLEAMAEKVISEAAANNQREDDCSVGLVRLHSKLKKRDLSFADAQDIPEAVNN